MVIREYMPADEREWLRCRVVSFLDCSYWNDVKTAREVYNHPSVSLVAEEGGQIVGLIDLELDSEDLAHADRGHGAILWHLAVLPEYRRRGVAAQLWRNAEQRLTAAGVTYCELWTQEDEAANRFYQAMGFQRQDADTWIRCYARWDAACGLLDPGKIGRIYGAEELVFQAAPDRREELRTICYRIDEVRLYAKRLGSHEAKEGTP